MKGLHCEVRVEPQWALVWSCTRLKSHQYTHGDEITGTLTVDRASTVVTQRTSTEMHSSINHPQINAYRENIKGSPSPETFVHISAIRTYVCMKLYTTVKQ